MAAALEQVDELIHTVNSTNLTSRSIVIGVCGGISSGKSTLCSILAEQYKFNLVNVDKIGHELLTEDHIIDQIVETFGDQVLKSSDNDESDSKQREIDRKKLGPIVFADSNKMDELSAITWPAIIQRISEKVKEFKENAKDGTNYLFVEAAVLIEAGWMESGVFDEVWVTIVERKITITRLMKRNNLSEEQALQRINIQPTNEAKIAALKEATNIKRYVLIENNEDGLEQFKKAIEDEVTSLKQRYEQADEQTDK